MLGCLQDAVRAGLMDSPAPSGSGTILAQNLNRMLCLIAFSRNQAEFASKRPRVITLAAGSF